MAVDPSQMQGGARPDPFGALPGGSTNHPPAGTPRDTVGSNGWTYHWVANGQGGWVIDEQRPATPTAATRPPAETHPKNQVWVDQTTNTPYILVTDDEGNVNDVKPLPGFQPQTGWTYREQDGGLIAVPTQPGMVNPATNRPYEPQWVIAPDQELRNQRAAQAAAQVRASNAQVASSEQSQAIAQAQEQRQRDIYSRDTTRQQYLDDRQLALDAAAQAQDYWKQRLNLGYEMPRQYVGDVNAARVNQVQEAERALLTATQRQTALRTAGQDALEMTQWNLAHAVGPAAQQTFANVGAHPGAMPNQAAFLRPLPDMQAIFEQARGRAGAEIPTYEQQLARTAPYGVYRPPLEELYGDFEQNYRPSLAFLPAIGLPQP